MIDGVGVGDECWGQGEGGCSGGEAWDTDWLEGCMMIWMAEGSWGGSEMNERGFLA